MTAAATAPGSRSRRSSGIVRSPVPIIVLFLLLAPLTMLWAQENESSGKSEKKEVVHAKTLAELGGSLHLDPETGAGKGLVIDNEKLKELGAGVHLSEGKVLVKEANKESSDEEDPANVGRPAPPVRTPEELMESSSNLSDEEIREAIRKLRLDEADARKQMLKATPEEKKELRKQIKILMERRKDMESVQKSRGTAKKKAPAAPAGK